MKDIYGKLLKEWGGFQIGDVVRFGASKFDHLAALDIVEKTHKQRAVNDPPEPPKIEPPPKKVEVETATAEPQDKPETETAEVTPRRRRGRPKLKENTI